MITHLFETRDEALYEMSKRILAAGYALAELLAGDLTRQIPGTPRRTKLQFRIYPVEESEEAPDCVLANLRNVFTDGTASVTRGRTPFAWEDQRFPAVVTCYYRPKTTPQHEWYMDHKRAQQKLCDDWYEAAQAKFLAEGHTSPFNRYGETDLQLWDIWLEWLDAYRASNPEPIAPNKTHTNPATGKRVRDWFCPMPPM